MNEFKIIKKFFCPLTKSHKFSQNLSDDVAKISLKKNQELVISKDIFVENVHFLLQDGGFNIASKLLLTNLSDIAASGGTPLCYMMGFTKNDRLGEKFYQDFARGLRSVQNKFNIFLIGGDTTSSKQLFFSLTIFGIVEKNKILSRNKAQNQDLIYVSGTIGDAGLGLAEHQKQQKKLSPYQKFLIKRHLLPNPRISLGQNLLSKNLSNCAIDVSDGLLADLKHICESSKMSAEIFFDQIPTSNSAQKFLKTNSLKNPLDLLSSGDDYELIFTSKATNHQKILELSKQLKVKITCIGSLKNSKKPEVFLFKTCLPSCASLIQNCDEEAFQSIISNSKTRINKRTNLKNIIKITKFGYEH